MPQSSRVMATRDASARQRASSGGDAAVRTKSSGASAAAEVLRIRQCLLRLPPTCKHLRRRPVDQLVGVTNAEVMPAVEVVELLPGDRRRYRRSLASTRGIG